MTIHHIPEIHFSSKYDYVIISNNDVHIGALQPSFADLVCSAGGGPTGSNEEIAKHPFMDELCRFLRESIH